MDDTNSVVCLKSELDLFNDVPIQLGIDSSTFLEVHPVASLSENTPIEFYISGNGEHYLDLSHTILQLRVKIVKKNGTNLADTDDVAPINYFLNTIFSELSLFLNEKQVASQANYAYRALLECLLFSSKASQESIYGAALFYKDTASQHDAHVKTATNSGYNSRHALCENSKVMDIMGPLHFDLASQPKLLINGVNVRIKLEKNKEVFSLIQQQIPIRL